MSGTLSPEGTPGGGLTMTISLPAATQPISDADSAKPIVRAKPRIEPVETAQRATMTRVLVVDDEPQILRALRINLHARQYDVVTAGTGRGALEAATDAHPDLVILDLGLPDMDGVDVIRSLRKWTQVPIVILSGRMNSAAKVDALDAGADDYVTKPFSVEELLARIRAVTRRTTEPELVEPVAARTVDRRSQRPRDL